MNALLGMLRVGVVRKKLHESVLNRKASREQHFQEAEKFINEHTQYDEDGHVIDRVIDEGDLAFYSEEEQTKRRRLRHDPQIVEQLTQWWQVL